MYLTFFFIDILNPEFEKKNASSFVNMYNDRVYCINEDIVPCKVFWITYIIALSKDRSLNWLISHQIMFTLRWLKDKAPYGHTVGFRAVKVVKIQAGAPKTR